MVMTIKWQRLVTDDGETCERCGTTQEEFRKAVAVLRESLRPLGIEVVSEEKALSTQEFAASTIESNRILVDGRSLEEWLGGETGKSECGSCCSAVGKEVECRTVSVDGLTHEAIPAELIVRAGLLAAEEMMGGSERASCCSGASGISDAASPCCCGAADVSCCASSGEDDGGKD